MKAILNIFLTISVLIAAGCTTPVAIDPQSGQEQTAEYRAGYFYAPLDAEIGEVFKTSIAKLDELGYYRTGELHRKSSITIYARKVGDEKVTVRSYYPEEPKEGEVSTIRIRVGTLGNLPESQMIYAAIRDAL